jgi:hypothetical protein
LDRWAGGDDREVCKSGFDLRHHQYHWY